MILLGAEVIEHWQHVGGGSRWQEKCARPLTTAYN